MKTVQFFWNYFKVYKLSIVVVILMIVLATLVPSSLSGISGQAVTELANLVQAYQKWQSRTCLAKPIRNHGQSWSASLVLFISSVIYMCLMTRRDCRIGPTR